MNKQGNFDQKIEDILGSLSKIERAKPQDFFYTRLQAKMERKLVQEPRLRWLLKPAFVVPVFLIALGMNVLTITEFQKTDTSSKEEFIETYSLTASDDIELY